MRITDHGHDVADADLPRQRVTCNNPGFVSVHTFRQYVAKFLASTLARTGGSEGPALGVMTLLVPNFLFQVHDDPGETEPDRRLASDRRSTAKGFFYGECK